jgi:hypothetical protein
VFWISYEDLLRNYQHFDRTRLFGPEWIVTQRWTSVEVPWSVDYLEDPKFRIAIPKSGPVVIVLSQLDDRYFRGLEGQYEFHLQFRLHKEDEYDYIVRSNKAYYMKRSVSTELDLEAGTYWVLLKITAKRFPDSPTVEDVITRSCQLRREKLLSVGLSYDMAHAKGEFNKLWDEKSKKEKLTRRERRKAMARKMHAARTKEHKKRKLRAMKIDMKKQDKMARRMANEAATRLESLNLQQREMGSNGMPTDVYGQPGFGNGPTASNGYQPPVASAPSGPAPGRRNTLTVDHGRHYSGFAPVLSRPGTPDIRVQRASFSPAGGLTLSDVSSDDLGWDSELDAPDDTSDEGESFDFSGPDMKDGKGGKDDDADEFERDPWNAVCVIGLRVFSKGQEVTIDVIRDDDDIHTGEGGEMESPMFNYGRKTLDVDDSAKDSVEANSPLSPTPRRLVGLEELLSREQ